MPEEIMPPWAKGKKKPKFKGIDYYFELARQIVIGFVAILILYVLIRVAITAFK